MKERRRTDTSAQATPEVRVGDIAAGATGPAHETGSIGAAAAKKDGGPSGEPSAAEKPAASTPKTPAAAARQRPAREPVTWGYARVSAKDQNLARQIDALTAFPVEPERIVCDKASGRDFERAGYQRLLRRLRAGDVLVVMSIDRLGRNYDEILAEWRRLTQEREVQMVVLDMALLDTRAQRGDLTGRFLADVTLELLSYVAQIERENTRRRQAEGIAAAKARGVRFGRPRIERPADYADVVAAWRAGELSPAEAAQNLHVSLSTLYNWQKADRAQQEA